MAAVHNGLDPKEIDNYTGIVMISLRYHKNLIILALKDITTDNNIINNILEDKLDLSSYISDLDDKLRDNADFMLSMLEFYPNITLYLSDRLFNDSKFMMRILNTTTTNLLYLSKLKDEALILNWIKCDPESIEELDSPLIDNKEFIIKLMEINSIYLVFASSDLQNDPELLEKALIRHEPFTFITEKCIYNRELMVNMFKWYHICIYWDGVPFDVDDDLVMLAVKSHYKNYDYLYDNIYCQYKSEVRTEYHNGKILYKYLYDLFADVDRFYEQRHYFNNNLDYMVKYFGSRFAAKKILYS